jgi:hypothetical protein
LAYFAEVTAATKAEMGEGRVVLGQAVEGDFLIHKKRPSSKIRKRAFCG